MKKEIVLLTKSKKFGAYCIAGIDVLTNQWIRIVASGGGAIKKIDACYENGDEAEILDIIEVEITGEDNIAFQPENYIMKARSKWIKKGSASFDVIYQKAAKDANSNEKVFYDLAYQIPGDFLKCLNRSEVYSLMIIKIHNPYLILNKDNEGSIPKGKLSFYYKGEHYNYFRITDTDFLKSWQNQDHMCSLYGDYYIVISLGEESPHDGRHYKLIAKIFSVGR
ncbi:hypothetical protein MASR2M70_03280 [Bacillota bacterium]